MILDSFRHAVEFKNIQGYEDLYPHAINGVLSSESVHTNQGSRCPPEVEKPVLVLHI